MERTSPGLFAYAWEPLPQGDPAHRTAAVLLRATGFLFLGLVAVALAMMAPGLAHLDSFHPAALAVVPLLSVVYVLCGGAAAAYFASYTYFHWARRDRRGLLHAYLLGAGLLWIGGFGVWTSRTAQGVSGQAWLALQCLVAAWGVLLLVACARPAARAPFQPAPATPA